MGKLPSLMHICWKVLAKTTADISSLLTVNYAPFHQGRNHTMLQLISIFFLSCRSCQGHGKLEPFPHFILSETLRCHHPLLLLQMFPSLISITTSMCGEHRNQHRCVIFRWCRFFKNWPKKQFRLIFISDSHCTSTQSK